MGDASRFGLAFRVEGLRSRIYNVGLVASGMMSELWDQDLLLMTSIYSDAAQGAEGHTCCLV